MTIRGSFLVTDRWVVAVEGAQVAMAKASRSRAPRIAAGRAQARPGTESGRQATKSKGGRSDDVITRLRRGHVW